MATITFKLESGEEKEFQAPLNATPEEIDNVGKGIGAIGWKSSDAPSAPDTSSEDVSEPAPKPAGDVTFNQLGQVYNPGKFDPSVRPGADELIKEASVDAAKLAASVAAEVSIGMAGQAGGTAVGLAGGPLGVAAGYIVGSLGGGYLGSVAAQEIEGRKFSFGRAMIAAGLNLWPSSAAIRGGIKVGSKVAPKLVAKASAKSMAKGNTPARTALTKLSHVATKPLIGGPVTSEVIRGASFGAIDVNVAHAIDSMNAGEGIKFAGPKQTALAMVGGGGAGGVIAGLGKVRWRTPRTKKGEIPKDEVGVNRAISEDAKATERMEKALVLQINNIEVAKQAAPRNRKVGFYEGSIEKEEFEDWEKTGEKPVVDNKLNSLAAVNRNTGAIKYNPVAIKKDFDDGMPYLQGKGEGILAEVSQQKALVLKNINVAKLHKAIGSAERYEKFIFAHEVGHNKLHFNQEVIMKPDGSGQDYMHPANIEREIQVNEYAAKALGINWNALAKDAPVDEPLFNMNDGIVVGTNEKGAAPDIIVPQQPNHNPTDKRPEIKQAWANTMSDSGKEQLISDKSSEFRAMVEAKTPEDAKSAFEEVVAWSNRTYRPSMAIGQDLTRAIEYSKNQLDGIKAAGAKHLNSIAAHLDWAKSPFNKSKISGAQVEQEIGRFIDGANNQDLPALKAIKGDLLGYRNVMNQAQEAIANIIGPNGITTGWSADKRKRLFDAIQDGIIHQNYTTTIYDIFLDKKWTPPVGLRKWSVSERAVAIYDQLVKFEESLMSGGTGKVKGVEQKFWKPENRALSTDYSAEKSSAIEAELRVITAQLQKKKQSSINNPHALALAMNEYEIRVADLENRRYEGQLTKQDLGTIEKKAIALSKEEHRVKEQASFQGKKQGIENKMMPEVTNILEARRTIGHFEGKYLGTVKDRLKKAIASVSAVGRMQAGLELDVKITKTFLAAVDDPNSIFGKVYIGDPNDANYDKLLTKTGMIDKDIYVDRWVNKVMHKLMNGNELTTFDIPIVNGVFEVLLATHTAWKVPKTLGNPSTWAVNVASTVSSMAMNGVLPTPSNIKEYFKAVRMGLGEYEWFDKWEATMADPAARKKMVDEAKELISLGIFSDNITVADLLQHNPKGPVGKFANGVLTPLSIGYNIPDNAARAVVFVKNQKRLIKIFPGIEGDMKELKRIAAEMTLDTMQYYDRLSKIIKGLSKVGGLSTFVAFPADFARTTKNFIHINAHLATGSKYSENFLRKRYRIKSPRFDPNQARMSGIHNLLTMVGIIVGAAAYVGKRNEENGWSKEEAEAFSNSYSPPWDQGKPLSMSKRTKENPMEITYIQGEYVIPILAVSNMFQKLLRNPSIDGLQTLMEDAGAMFGGEGSPVYAGLVDIVRKDLEGKHTPDHPNAMRRMLENFLHVAHRDYMPGFAKDAANYVLADPLKYPQDVVVMAQKLSPNGTKLTQDEIALRLLAIRPNHTDLMKTFSSSINKMYSEYKDMMQAAQSDYRGSVGNEKDTTPEATERLYSFVDKRMSTDKPHYDLIKDKMDVFLIDTGKAKIFNQPEIGVDHTYITEALRMSGVSNAFKLEILKAWNGLNPFQLPIETKEEFVQASTTFEISKMNNADFEKELALDYSGLYALDQSQKSQDLNVVKQVTLEQRKAMNFTAIEDVLADSSVKERIDWLVEQGHTDASSDIYRRLRSIGVITKGKNSVEEGLGFKAIDSLGR